MKDAQRTRLYAKAGHDVADTIMLAVAVSGAGDVPRVAAMTILSVAIMDVIERNFSREDIPGVIDQMHRSLHGSLKLVQNQSTQPPESVKHWGQGDTPMPSVSEKQRKAMQAAAHGESKLGIPPKVGKEFAAADKAKKGPFKLPKRKGKKPFKGG